MASGASVARHGRLVEILDEIAAADIPNLKNRASAKTARAAVLDSLFLEEFTKIAGERIRRQTPSLKKVPKKKRIQRVVQVMWSDHHHGMCLGGREFPYPYGGVEESRRVGALVKQLIEYKTQYRDHTTAMIHIIGDMFQGTLHDPRDGAPLALQVDATMGYLAQAVRVVAGEFSEVDVWCSPGNHGRNQSRHHDRAVCQKFDSLENVMYAGMAQGLKHIPNVRVHLDRKPFYRYQVFDHVGFMTHGDTVIAAGFPGRSLNVEKVRAIVNKWSVADRRKYAVVGVGHTHTGAMVALPEGGTFLYNGCLPPFDYFSQSMGNPSTHSCQWMWETTEKYMVGDARLIELSKDTDQDKSLNDLITPYQY